MQTYQQPALINDADALLAPEADFPGRVVQQITASAAFLAGIKASQQRQSGFSGTQGGSR